MDKLKAKRAAANKQKQIAVKAYRQAAAKTA